MSLLENSQYSWNIFLFRRSIQVLQELVRSRTQNFAIIDQEKHKIEQIAFETPWLLDKLCKLWLTSSVWNFSRWGADDPSGETSPASRSDERRLFSQATIPRDYQQLIFVLMTGSAHTQLYVSNCTIRLFWGRILAQIEWRRVTSGYHGNKFSGSQRSFLTLTANCIVAARSLARAVHFARQSRLRACSLARKFVLLLSKPTTGRA